jgi:hypothetical protein
VISEHLCFFLLLCCAAAGGADAGLPDADLLQFSCDEDILSPCRASPDRLCLVLLLLLLLLLQAQMQRTKKQTGFSSAVMTMICQRLTMLHMGLVVSHQMIQMTMTVRGGTGLGVAAAMQQQQQQQPKQQQQHMRRQGRMIPTTMHMFWMPIHHGMLAAAAAAILRSNGRERMLLLLLLVRGVFKAPAAAQACMSQQQ